MNREIIKKYNEIITSLKKDKSEANKQKYMIIFKELDLQLSKELDQVVYNNAIVAKDLNGEVKRITTILTAIRYRTNFRDKMVKDYKSILGYKPKNLSEIPYEEEEYKTYLEDINKGKEIISFLLESGQKITELKTEFKKKIKNKKKLNREIDKIQHRRAKLLEEIKKDLRLRKTLYNFVLTAPFSDENAYIQYILIKFNSDEKESKAKEEVKEEKKKVDLNSIITENFFFDKDLPMIEYEKPKNMLDFIKEAIKKYPELNLPTNGLGEQIEKITIEETKR